MASDKVRIDKYLWSIRLYKTRTLAADACKENKVKLNGVNCKASADIKVGDEVSLKKDGFTWSYKILALIASRVSAALAQPCYENTTPESELNKYKEWFDNKSANELRERGAGRPTKRDRRDIDKFKEI